MKSNIAGKNISEIEITNISTHGFWLFCRDEEFFMPYKKFPFFKEAPLKKILNFQEISPNHFYWPDLDVDLGMEIIQNPDRFPLIAK